MRRTRPMKRAARAPARPRRAGGRGRERPPGEVPNDIGGPAGGPRPGPLGAGARRRRRGGHLQLELGLLPRTVIDAQAGEHLGVDTEPGPTGTLAAGRRIGAWRVRLALGHRYVNTDGLLKADFQTNGSLTLWSGLLEAFRDVDLDPATGLPLEVFAGLGAGVAYADLHDLGRGNGSEVVPAGDAQAGLAWPGACGPGSSCWAGRGCSPPAPSTAPARSRASRARPGGWSRRSSSPASASGSEPPWRGWVRAAGVASPRRAGARPGSGAGARRGGRGRGRRRRGGPPRDAGVGQDEQDDDDGGDDVPVASGHGRSLPAAERP